MSEPFIAQINVFSFSFAPRNWVQCNGQLLPINQWQAVFALLGTTFGGDGRVTFGLPNLQGSVPVGALPGGQTTWGQRAGEATHPLTPAETPVHSHVWSASDGPGTINTAAGNVPAGLPIYIPPSELNLGAMNAATIGGAGGNLPHENRQPYLVLNFCIALQGIFPTPN